MISRNSVPATIAESESLSDVVELLGYDLVAVQLPATWTAASVTFQCSQDGITFSDVHDDAGTEVALTVAASQWVTVPTEFVRHFGTFIKVRSGTSSVPVAQAAERVIQVIGSAPH